MKLLLVITASAAMVICRSEEAVPSVKLASGYNMPLLGLGTYRLRKKTKIILTEALDIGYRLIDTASSYMVTDKIASEQAVGEVLAKSSIPRSELFIVTKITPDAFDDEGFRRSLQMSLEGLQTDYIDLLLVHFPDCEGDPYCKITDTLENAWKRMEAAVDEGKIRSLGLSNSYEINIKQIEAIAKKPISVLQNWLDPYYQDNNIRQVCDEKNIFYMSYSTLGAGWLDDGMKHNPILNDDQLQAIAEKHRCSVSNVVLQWAIASSIIVIPGTTKSAHLKENFNRLDDKDMDIINKLDGKLQPLNGPPGGVEEEERPQENENEDQPSKPMYKKTQFSWFRFVYGLGDVLLSYVGLGLPGAKRDEF